MGGVMKCATEMGSVAMIGSGIQKLIGGNKQTHRQDGDSISLPYESRLKTGRLRDW
jgi:hypothetical protein